MFNDYVGRWGDRYITSNVKVYNQTSKEFQYVGSTHRYFTTAHGLRLMAFGVLFDFTGNSNVSQVIKAQDMIQESWFLDALNTKEPIDAFVLIGHNPVRTTDSTSTFKTVWDAIRAVHPKTPIQLFGGHTHIRDFEVYDDSSVAIESGRYCETLGWLSMSGFNKHNSGYCGVDHPHGVENVCRPAANDSKSGFLYSRRYMDWNRATFIYHTNQHAHAYDSPAGVRITEDITKDRKELNLGHVYGCAPQNWCIDCAPFDNADNIFPGVIVPAAEAIVVNRTRKAFPRILFGNTGGIRFDLYKGPFTYDDNFVVSPFRDVFLYIADVPYPQASQLLQK